MWVTFQKHVVGQYGYKWVRLWSIYVDSPHLDREQFTNYAHTLPSILLSILPSILPITLPSILLNLLPSIMFNTLPSILPSIFTNALSSILLNILRTALGPVFGVFFKWKLDYCTNWNIKKSKKLQNLPQSFRLHP